ncbi:hypothetical protein [Hyunsoonleella pacifica]|uniref:Uncharacterized protein n=1 Tax=Hyunsoonleella pacifica TaxID=1080224 RepID=A0A4Q9FSQ9_9FLAO|nr:hypothetical protein [Hyunsoonleella pacifica]TBN18836.1 hypothetical protein EYD46_01870 [Hyunsoonleella pacifica]GGD05207.1 hypothetical protein GCM10011368_03740 [Hyunsoonleella pacifica]
MKTNIIKFVIILTLIPLFVTAQNGEIYYYLDSKNKVQKIEVNDVKESITLIENPKSFGAAATSILPDALKFGLKNLSKLIYNPKKYVATFGSEVKLFEKSNDSLINYFGLSGFTYKKVIGGNALVQLDFDIIPPFGKDIIYSGVELQSVTHNFSAAKLKNGSKNQNMVNLIVDVTISYFDNNGEKQKIELNSYTLNNHLPKNRGAIIFDSPQMEIFNFKNLAFVESIEVRITEVNARKKYWDKLLEEYDNKKDKIQEALLELIKKEDES